MISLLWLITILMLLLWLLGFAVNIGAWIHFLLVVAIVLLVVNVASSAMRASSTATHDSVAHDHEDVHHHH